MTVQENKVDNKGVSIHYIDSAPDGGDSKTAMVFVPGALGAAGDFLKEIEALAPRRCVAISLRGRGQSDTPRKGYTLDDHVSDIEAVVDTLALRDFCLMGYSAGVPYVIEYTARYPERVVHVEGDPGCRAGINTPEDYRLAQP